MILLDTNQLFLASYFVHRRFEDQVNEKLLRHLFLNTIRLYRNMFKDEYGEVVLCLESSNCWRKQYFPHYKAARKLKRDDSHDWKTVFECFENYLKEINEVFPWMQVRVPESEADDIIAVVCQKFHCDEKIMIVSNDKDFLQLQRYPAIKQFSPIKKELLVCTEPKNFLLEHILKGDTSDGVPNILSDDDVFIDETKRQKPLGKKKMQEFISKGHFAELKNWERNQTLVDFSRIPDRMREEIVRSYKNEKSHRENQRQEILNSPGNSMFTRVSTYFTGKELYELVDKIGDFV